MNIVHVPQRNSGRRPWPALVRFFGFERQLGGVRVEATLRLYELDAPDRVPVGGQVVALAQDGNPA